MIFGHQNDDTNTPSPASGGSSATLNPLAVDPATGASLPVAPSDSDTSSILNQGSASDPMGDDIPPPPPPANSDASTDAVDGSTSVEPTMPFMAEPSPANTPTPLNLPEVSTEATESSNDSSDDGFSSESSSSDAPADGPASSPALTGSASDDASSPTTADDLLGLKQQALTQLSPLIGQLDQTPEEKFRTIMMLIQSSDNQTLIPNAYEAAQAIPDEKVRAQALLDVINEINYFTQKDA